MNLTQNESTIDRTVRIIAGVVLAAIAVSGVVAVPRTYAVWVVVRPWQFSVTCATMQ